MYTDSNKIFTELWPDPQGTGNCEKEEGGSSCLGVPRQEASQGRSGRQRGRPVEGGNRQLGGSQQSGGM